MNIMIDKVPLIDLTKHFHNAGTIDKDLKIIKRESAGEGNMNCTLRCTLSDGQTIIVKQSRPWVEKFPDIPAPVERVNTENQFYGLVCRDMKELNILPAIQSIDESNHIMTMEDLGESNDFTSLYRRNEHLSTVDTEVLVKFLNKLHSLSKTPGNSIDNIKMRKLNHAHIFVIPLQNENGLDLNSITAGLEEGALDIKQSKDYHAQVDRLGEIYLQEGGSLLHGDFFPGSWLKTNDGMKIIDPEFCFHGHAEIDWGIFLAHIILSKQKSSVINELLNSYCKPTGWSDEIAYGICGVEIMRRLIGYAQLPIDYSLGEKIELLSLSKKLVLNWNRGEEIILHY